MCKVTSNLLSSPTLVNEKWKHLSGLELADSDLGSPEALDLPLSADIFILVVINGQWFGPHGSRVALKRIFDGCSVEP